MKADVILLKVEAQILVRHFDSLKLLIRTLNTQNFIRGPQITFHFKMQ